MWCDQPPWNDDVLCVVVGGDMLFSLSTQLAWISICRQLHELTKQEINVWKWAVWLIY